MAAAEHWTALLGEIATSEHFASLVPRTLPLLLVSPEAPFYDDQDDGYVGWSDVGRGRTHEGPVIDDKRPLHASPTAR